MISIDDDIIILKLDTARAQHLNKFNMDKIDLDAIIIKFKAPISGRTLNEIVEHPSHHDMIKEVMKEAIHQALVLASKRCTVRSSDEGFGTISDAQSILDVEKLII